MKWLVGIAGLILMLPLVSFADSELIFTDTGGVFTGDSHGYTLTGATVTGVSGGGFGSHSGADLGAMTVTTGILGSISNVRIGGPILAGGLILITSNGSDGLPAGTLFMGTFPQGGTWLPMIDSSGNYLYTLTEAVTSLDGSSAGLFVLTLDTGQLPYYGNSFTGYNVASFIPNGTTTVTTTATTATTVPEPGELGLLGAGVLGLAGSFVQKFKRKGS